LLALAPRRADKFVLAMVRAGPIFFVKEPEGPLPGLPAPPSKNSKPGHQPNHGLPSLASWFVLLIMEWIRERDVLVEGSEAATVFFLVPAGGPAFINRSPFLSVLQQS
jgi:hypothetical protein